MIKIPLPRILFLDIETVGLEKDHTSCVEKHPRIAEQFDKYFDWFLKRFPEDQLIEDDQKNKVFSRMLLKIYVHLMVKNKKQKMYWFMNFGKHLEKKWNDHQQKMN